MLALLEDPQIRARVPAMTVEVYHQLAALGNIAPNVELIRGALIEKMPRSPLHSSIVRLLDRYFLAALPSGWCPRAEQPLTFEDSEPEPDYAIVRGADADYFLAHPQIAQLVMEACVTSERLDRVKLELYAEAGVPECWLVLAEERVVERHTEPQGASGYARVERVAAPATLESTVFPGLHLPPAEIWPFKQG